MLYIGLIMLRICYSRMIACNCRHLCRFVMLSILSFSVAHFQMYPLQHSKKQYVQWIRF